MTDPDGASQGMARALDRSLRRHRFPFRRDVALDGRTFGAGCAFVDHHWLDGSTLAVAVAATEEGDLLQAARLSCFRDLLRAACEGHGRAGPALGEALRTYGALFAAAGEPDCALAIFRLPQGEIDAAVGGSASCERLAQSPEAAPMPEAERLLRLWAGRDIPRLAGSDIGEHPQEAAERTLGSLPSPDGGGAVAYCRVETARAGTRDLILPLENGAHEVEPAQARMAAFLQGRAVPAEAATALLLSFDELFTNIVSYAHGDGRPHEVVVTLSAGADEAVLELRDDGHPFDPRGADPSAGTSLDEHAVGGLGIGFVRQLVDDLRYERAKGWNVLRLTKRFVRESGDSPGPVQIVSAGRSTLS